jgi:uncharacterized protein (TIGR02679 family)
VTADLTLLAGDPDLAPLWAVIHERLCAGHEPGSIASVKVPGLSPPGVAALRSWLDTSARRRRGKSSVPVSPSGASVPVRELLEVLGIRPDDLQPLAEQAVGRPVLNRAAARRDAAGIRQELWAYAAGELPDFPGLLARLRATGISDDDAPARRLIRALAAAARRLPCAPPVSLAKLSHDCAGDPHYFDLDTYAGALLVSAAAEISGRPEPARPDLARALLLDAGVIADRLSATVLLHQVKAIGDGPVDRRLRDSDTPVALTLLDLTRTPPTLAPQTLTVVENPSVLEAALASGSRLPLACTSGHLGSVDHALLQLAADQGLRLRYAGDLDEHGYRIAGQVARTYGAQLIAMDAATIQAAGPEPSAVPLTLVPDTPDPQAAEALRESKFVLFQEHDAITGQVLTSEPGSTEAANPTARACVPGKCAHLPGTPEIR